MLKKLPQRTCLGCQRVKPKREMIRIVRTLDGKVELDPTGKKAGRGAYVCPSERCFRQMVKKQRLGKALGVEPSSSLIAELERSIFEYEGSLE